MTSNFSLKTLTSVTCWSTLRHISVVILYVWTSFNWQATSAAPWVASREDLVDLRGGPMNTTEKWLADETFYDITYPKDRNTNEQESSNDLMRFESNLCPPVPAPLLDGSCDVHQCSSDKQCEGKELICCFNGCVYTCLPTLVPAPHFDWIVEPRRRLQNGPSWLISGPDDVTNEETCSTSPIDGDDDSDPLICPHGYECSIDDPGQPKLGIPNSGHCVKMIDVKQEDSENVHQQSASMSHDHNVQGDAPHAMTEIHGCMLDEGRMLVSGHSMIIDDKECLCFKEKLMCDL